jgi:hypothetical protein
MALGAAGLAAGLSAAVPHATVAAAQPAALTDLSTVDELRLAFEHDSGKPRVILLLSPT